MILLMILWVAYSIAEAYEDSQYTVILNHEPTVYPRLITGALITFLWMQFAVDSRPWTVVFILSTVFWFIFELAGNLFRGNYFSYIGTTSKIDRQLKKYELAVFYLRVWLIVFSFCLYYYNELSYAISY